MPEQRYTKRPDQIHAIPAHEVLDAAVHAWDDLPQWIKDAYENGAIVFEPDMVKIQNALSDNATGTDMIIWRGEPFPIVALPVDQFDATYAPAEDVTP